ncbi:MAG TPA: DinB family protein [Thermoanaerobaculia bacterium]
MEAIRSLLLANLEEAYRKRGWHGTNLRGAIRGLTADQVLWRPAKERHNIWELTVHAAYWKYAVRRRLTGTKRGSFPIKGSNWIASPSRPDVESWRQVVTLLDEQHQELRSAVEAMGDGDLSNPSKLQLVYGVAAHDLYHTGQIQLTKRLMAGA